jgi:PIN domain nuclease of toxin-antitoxin system
MFLLDTHAFLWFVTGDEQLARNSISVLPIQLPDLSRLIELPFHHRDPFDRLLAAQSLANSMPLISADSIFDQYQVDRIWGD